MGRGAESAGSPGAGREHQCPGDSGILPLAHRALRMSALGRFYGDAPEDRNGQDPEKGPAEKILGGPGDHGRAEVLISMPALFLESLGSLKDHVGNTIATTDWLPVTQERINQFADAT